MSMLALIRHGPEIRYLEGLRVRYTGNGVTVLVERSVVKEVSRAIGDSYQIHSYDCSAPSRRRRLASLIVALSDSFARKVNERRGIGHFSYSRRNQGRSIARGTANPGGIKLASILFLSTGVSLAWALARWLYRDETLVSCFKKSGCDRLLVFDHLGGTDEIACNARLAGLAVDYFLNNHKDLSIRPYVPPIANVFSCWFDCQIEAALEICGSRKKMRPVGLLRIEKMLRSCTATPIRPSSQAIHVLHCCSDPRRRPYEIVSLMQICELVKNDGLPIRLTVRLNPMDNTRVMKLLQAYNFVDVAESGWIWNKTRFLNIPDRASDTEYARQLFDADVVSALPSTTLVEGYLFGKKAICFIDAESPDSTFEQEEERLCIPDTVRNSSLFKRVYKAEEFVNTVMGRQL